MVVDHPPAGAPTARGDESDDRALIARIGARDRSALEQLYRRHASWLTARLQSRCGDPDLADTAIQDTFVAVWRSPRSYRGEGEVGAWLWGIAIRRLIDQLRKRAATPVDPASIVEPALGPTEPVAQAVLGDGSHGDLGDALRTLPPELRAVLIATAIDGLSTKEAARLLGVPQGTVKTRLMRARRVMQEALT